MKLAIHHDAKSYSGRWIKYCEENAVEFKLVCCYDNDIIQQLDECDGLMWHWNQNDYKAALFARQLTLSLEKRGKAVFPNVNTVWHHDDKAGQKYLLEAVDAPLVKSNIFYSKAAAEKWLDKTNFPKVFKLRNGAASLNVKLAETRQEAQLLVNTAFGKGFRQINTWVAFKEGFWVLRRDKNFAAFIGLVKRFGRIFIPTELAKFSHREKGYVYFQDFLQGNKYDTRLVVVGDRCFGLRRYTRDNDFRASGSGNADYSPEFLDSAFIEIAFDTSEKLGAQLMAYDFIWDGESPKIIEISYCSTVGGQDACPGYWDRTLKWHAEKVIPEYFMIADFLKQIETGKQNN